MRTITAAFASVIWFVSASAIGSASLQGGGTQPTTAQQVVVLSVQGMT